MFEATKWLQCCRTSYFHTRLSTSRFTLSGFYTRSLSLLNSHCTPFASVLSGFSTNTAFNIFLSFPALSRTCPENARGQGHAGLFHETIHLKGPTTHWCTRRCRGSRDIVYGSADILGLLSTILQLYINIYNWY